METANIIGASGTTYTYYVATIDDNWRAAPVNYMFGRRRVGGWDIFYIGETDNARDRLPCHERWEEAARYYGATHILNHLAHPNEQERKREERDLILLQNPPMNTQHRGLGLLSTGTHAAEGFGIGLVSPRRKL